jgi:hypothetical protein
MRDVGHEIAANPLQVKPRALADRRTELAYLFGAIRPERGSPVNQPPPTVAGIPDGQKSQLQRRADLPRAFVITRSVYYDGTAPVPKQRLRSQIRGPVHQFSISSSLKRVEYMSRSREAHWHRCVE